MVYPAVEYQAAQQRKAECPGLVAEQGDGRVTETQKPGIDYRGRCASASSTHSLWGNSDSHTYGYTDYNTNFDATADVHAHSPANSDASEHSNTSSLADCHAGGDANPSTDCNPDTGTGKGLY